MAVQQQHHSKSKKFAELLDSRFNIPGTDIRIGIDPILGLVSGVGDWIGAAFSVYFMIFAARLGAKKSVLIRMFVNILVDLLFGLIPVLGDLFDVGWKANIRNAEILEKLEQNPEELETQSTWLLWLLLFFLISIIIGLLILIGWVMAEVWDMIF